MFQKCICVFVCVLCINVPPCPRTWWSIRPRNSQKSKRFQRQLLFDMSTIDDYILGWWCKCDGDDNDNAHNKLAKLRRYVKTHFGKISGHTYILSPNLHTIIQIPQMCRQGLFFIQIFLRPLYFHLNLYIFTSIFVISPQSLLRPLRCPWSRHRPPSTCSNPRACWQCWGFN